jgi:hypothetical protein
MAQFQQKARGIVSWRSKWAAFNKTENNNNVIFSYIIGTINFSSLVHCQNSAHDPQYCNPQVHFNSRELMPISVPESKSDQVSDPCLANYVLCTMLHEKITCGISIIIDLMHLDLQWKRAQAIAK